MNEEHATGHGSFTPAVSRVVVDGLGALLPALLVAAVAARWLRSLRRPLIPRARVAGGPLAPGPALLRGTVAFAGEPASIRVEVDQERTRAVWRESARRAFARPFFLRLGDGVEVHVEPGSDLELRAVPHTVPLEDPDRRLRVATLAAGEEVHVVGALRRDDDVDGGAGRWTLAAPPSGSVIVSPVAVEARPFDHARASRALVGAMIVWFVTLHGAVFGRYELLRWSGEVVHGDAPEARAWTEWVTPKRGPRRQERRYGLRARYRDAGGVTRALEDTCGEALYAEVARGGLRQVPFLVARRWPSIHQVGARPRVGYEAIAWVFVLLLGATPLAASSDEPRRWYDRRRLDEPARAGC